jgi:DNA (cytosine-5)-methyltransferase 1
MTPAYSNPPPLAIAPDELIVDNFAGGGGASLGIGMALGRSPDIAINHDKEAIAMHAANHPETKHYCEDVWHVDPIEACAGRPVGLAWFSPDCKHFSKAKGGKPVSKKIRGLAWVVIRWAKAVKPRVIILENVEEFQDWGPVLPDGQPCPLRKGQTFRRWKSQLENLGYRVEPKELRASDYGTPTIRKRLFIVARCDGLPIRWPEPTHGDPKKIQQDLFSINLKPWRTAAECIDWSLPCPSIFERQRPLAENTLRRIAAGIRRFVIEAKEPFIVNLTHHGGDRVEPLDEPFRTVTGANRGEKALCTPFIARTAHGDVDKNGKRRGKGQHSVGEPLHTVTASGDYAICTPFLAGVGGRAGQSPERSPDQPYQTITAKADAAIICPTLIQTGYGEREGQAPRVPGLDKPLGTVVAGAAKHALVTPLLVGTGGPAYSAKPRPAGQPMNTMTTDSRAALVSAFLAKHYTGVVGSDLPEPMGTVTATDHHSLVASHLLKLKGTCKHGQAVDQPLATVQAGGLHYAEVRAFLIKYFGTDQDPRLQEPLHTVTSKDRFGLVTVHGQDYVIVDIGLRMLTPPELYRAQGFPEHYLISPVIDGKPLSKTAQVRMCGNSVCPPIAAAVARAQFETAPVARAA